jgi:uncharacterized membrane protein YfcA
VTRAVSGALSSAFSQALAQPGLVLLVLAAAMAGLARGFSGFGSGLVYMPIAGMVLPPAQAVAVLVVMDLIGPLANVPGALKIGSLREVGTLALGMLAGVPVGLWALVAVAPEAFRWIISVLSLLTVAALVAGWQWRGGRGPRVTAGAGFVAGIVGGATAMPGPPVILYYMTSPMPVAQIRANLTLFLVLLDVLLVLVLGAMGRLTLPLALLSGLLLVPFSLANMAGSMLFRPDRVAIYRGLTWSMIAVSALVGLPLWDEGMVR